MVVGKTDIASEEDIKRMVDSFYASVGKDELLEPVFSKALGNDWNHHMPVMYKFWSTLLLGNASYQGNPFLKHIPLELSAKHFDRWLTLFIANVDELYEGVRTEDAKARAKSIAYIFQNKLGLLKHA